jgi:hyperosmotically inducible periplasmic protein
MFRESRRHGTCFATHTSVTVRGAHLDMRLAIRRAGTAGASVPALEPDNSKVNTRDRKPSQLAADQQENNRSDLQTTKEIRQALMADKSLSTYAHNVKIVTRNGEVTLKGPVRSEEEKKVVEAKATEVAGATNIMNQMSVTPKGRAYPTSSNK